MILKNINPKYEPSFSLSNRIYRFFWGIIQNTVFKYSPKNFFKFRKYLLLLFGAKIGKNTNIHNKVEIWSPANLIIGNNVGVANKVFLYNIEKIIVDDNSDISFGCSLVTGSHNYNDKNFQLYAKPIIIKKKVWICAECFIAPGVTINEGCVIGARTVVIKDITNEYGVYAGNPAKFISNRVKN